MGFAARSVSLMRYRVRDEIDGPFWDAVDEGVRKGAFKEVDTAGDEIGMGWASIDDFTDNSFQGASYARSTYVALSLRIDAVRVPPRVLEMQLKKEASKLREQLGTQRLSSAQQRELKERLKESLKKQVFPSIQVYDMIWDTGKAVVYFGSHAIRARERFEDHFKKCFGLTLVPLIPYLLAQESLEGKPELQLLETLKPCIMAP
jgi:hypothetical protein